MLSRSAAGPSRAISWNPAARPGTVTPGGGPTVRILPNSAAAGSADWSGRSSVTFAAWPAPIAIVTPLVAGWSKEATGMACRTPGVPVRAAAWPAVSG